MSQQRIEALERLSYEEKVRHWAGDQPWHFRSKPIRLPNQLNVDPYRIQMDDRGNIVFMQELVGKPCFGQLTAYLRHGGTQPNFVRKLNKWMDSRCMKCCVQRACQHVCEKRLKASPDVLDAMMRWERTGARQGFQTQNLPGWRSSWTRLVQTIVNHGPFLSSNDQVVLDHYARRHEERLRIDRERQRRKRRKDLAAGKFDPEFLGQLKRERTIRVVRLRQAIDHPASPGKLRRLNDKGVRLTVNSWAAREVLRLTNRKTNPSSIAREMIRNGDALGMAYETLRDRLTRRDLPRIAFLEKQQFPGETDPYWPKFDPFDKA